MVIYVRTAKLALAVAAIAAGATVLQQPASVLADPGDGGGGGCSTHCENGALGMGGDASGNKAQGTLFRTPSENFPGQTVSNSGNLHAGHLWVTNVGSASGDFDPDPPGALEHGHLTGIFGSCSGNLSKKTC